MSPARGRTLTMAVSRLSGKLLVANPRLADPNFDRSVVLVLAHTDDGALGVILNRPSATPLLDPLPRWAVLADNPSMVYEGGPVSPDSVICLARVPAPAVLESRAGPNTWRHVSGDVGTLDLDLDPDLIQGAVGSLRIFAGYAGWAAGQLEDELLAGGWWVLDAHPGDPFGDRPTDLWHDILRRQPGDLRIVAAYPHDLAVN
jgi:putative transcriptional regulator